jgi:hypothetical protein
MGYSRHFPKIKAPSLEFNEDISALSKRSPNMPNRYE